MSDPIELEITPINGEIQITMPSVESIELELIPLLTPDPGPDIDFLAQYLLARG